ncbi:putative uncharacterized protein DDB_G0277057 [Octopus bimaculoides]|uniref:putative uncharacterized protein DDB_G0277057 n=1 Tax=Octopus bimaculoides TaxID=37653 RepID=UPI00071D8AF4|nr:putative uncharacterized protein DDB_G0277057 [Octopus bimaculoides]|eukprot:XP_014772178.1 PREDICTED: putative uncharacterized protein DDB_G0277057 [Octopus bimaculoides]
MHLSQVCFLKADPELENNNNSGNDYSSNNYVNNNNSNSSSSNNNSNINSGTSSTLTVLNQQESFFMFDLREILAKSLSDNHTVASEKRKQKALNDVVPDIQKK